MVGPAVLRAERLRSVTLIPAFAGYVRRQGSRPAYVLFDPRVCGVRATGALSQYVSTSICMPLRFVRWGDDSSGAFAGFLCRGPLCQVGLTYLLRGLGGFGAEMGPRVDHGCTCLISLDVSAATN